MVDPIKLFVALLATAINVVWHYHTRDMIGMLLSMGAVVSFGGLMAAIEKEVMMIFFREELKKLRQENEERK